MAFRAAYKKANGVSTTDAFSPYAFDAWLVFLDSAKRALAKAKPGTQDFPRRVARSHGEHEERGRRPRGL